VLWLNQKFVANVTAQNVLESLTITISVTFILGALTNNVLFNKIMKQVGETCHASISVLESGVKDVKFYWNDIDFNSLIRDSKKEILVIAIYSNTWLNNYMDELQSFVNKGKTTIKFIFLDADAENTVLSLQDKFSVANDNAVIDLKSKIQDSVAKVKSLKINEEPKRKYKKIVVKSHTMLPAYSLYKFDDTIVLVPYLFSPGRTNKIPAYILKKDKSDSLYEIYDKDIKSLLETFSKTIHEI
jgi:hypothetical protein